MKNVGLRYINVAAESRAEGVNGTNRAMYVFR